MALLHEALPASTLVIAIDPGKVCNRVWLSPSEAGMAVEPLSLPVLCHHDAGSQYTSIAFTERLAAAGAAPSVGTVGDALDNALAETQIGLFKTELIRRRGPWKNVDDVELATPEWVDWHNNRRLHTACHDLTPVEYEQVFYGQHPAQRSVKVSTP